MTNKQKPMAVGSSDAADDARAESLEELRRDMISLLWTDRYAQERWGIDRGTVKAERLAYLHDRTTSLPLGSGLLELEPLKDDNATAELQERNREQEAAKKAVGRYTLEEAAGILAAAGERIETMLATLAKAIEAGTLSTYEPGRKARTRYDPTKSLSYVRPFYEEIYWNDLNGWLTEHEPHVSYRFPRPERPETLAGNEQHVDHRVPQPDTAPDNVPAGKGAGYSQAELRRARAAYDQLNADQERISASAIGRKAGVNRGKISAMSRTGDLPPDAVQQHSQKNRKTPQ